MVICLTHPLLIGQEEQRGMLCFFQWFNKYIATLDVKYKIININMNNI